LGHISDIKLIRTDTTLAFISHIHSLAFLN